MSQTILALLGLTILTTMTMNTKRIAIVMQNQMVDEEMELYAGAIMRQTMRLVESKSFDFRSTPQQVDTNGLPPDSSAFSLSSSFGNTPICDPLEPFNDTVDCDDIDDLHMADTSWHAFSMPFANNQTMDFEVQVKVVYVDRFDDSNVYTGTNKSEAKRVTVSVRSPRHVAQGRYLNGFLSDWKVFYYDEERAAEEAAEWAASQP